VHDKYCSTGTLEKREYYFKHSQRRCSISWQGLVDALVQPGLEGLLIALKIKGQNCLVTSGLAKRLSEIAAAFRTRHKDPKTMIPSSPQVSSRRWIGTLGATAEAHSWLYAEAARVCSIPFERNMY
jgi:hypothetical protein